jgi:hypothetical protein
MLYDGNATEAVRAAVGQLFAYRNFLYTASPPSLLGLFSEPVGSAYVAFLESLSIAAVSRSAGAWGVVLYRCYGWSRDRTIGHQIRAQLR